MLQLNSITGERINDGILTTEVQSVLSLLFIFEQPTGLILTVKIICLIIVMVLAYPLCNLQLVVLLHVS